MPNLELPQVSIEDAEEFVVRVIREEPRKAAKFGYDVYLPEIFRWYAHTLGLPPNTRPEQFDTQLSPPFMDAAWELCRRGILRPGVQVMNAQSTDEGSAGLAFCLTPFGREWIRESDGVHFIPTEPGRFVELLTPLAERFGPGFLVRGQEASRCYKAHAYLACCAMSGAAAESILLATAIAKSSSDKVLREYKSAGGRRKVQAQLLAHARKQIREEFDSLSSLLHYWRDEAAHGEASSISDSKAFYTLAQLLRLGMFANDHWDELTRSPA